MDLSENTVIAYLRQTNRASAEGEILVQRLSAPESDNAVLKIFDTTGGERVGTDLRTPGQIKAGMPDTRMSEGNCFVLKQPRPRDGALDFARIHQERACLELLHSLLPAQSVPELRWFDDANGVLALSCPPSEAVLWHKQLTTGVISMDAAGHSAMLLAMIHSSTKKDAAVKERFSDGQVLLRQRVEPLIRATTAKHNALGKVLQDAVFRIRSPLTLIHGDFRPENILLTPAPASTDPDPAAKARSTGPKIAHVTLVDFESAYFGHNAYDVATMVSELLLMGFTSGGRWRACMLLADHFWQTYRHTADPELVRAAEVAGGRLLGALLLARIDGNVPLKELAEKREAQMRIRGMALQILKHNTMTLDEAIDEAAMHFDPPQEQPAPPPRPAARGAHHRRR